MRTAGSSIQIMETTQTPTTTEDTMTTKTTRTMLIRFITKRDCFVTSIHAQTGQATSEGILAEGALARNIITESTPEGSLTTFEASTDNGKHWYRTETFETVKGLFETARPFTRLSA